MKRFSLSDTNPSPVSHNPELTKRVLVSDGVIRGLRHLSHIIMPKGSTAIEHSHEGMQEVFYCISGSVVFVVNGKQETIGPGECIVIDPGERHSIADAPEQAEIIYFMAGQVIS